VELGDFSVPLLGKEAKRCETHLRRAHKISAYLTR
jgi:hypothetical protein